MWLQAQNTTPCQQDCGYDSSKSPVLVTYHASDWPRIALGGAQQPAANGVALRHSTVAAC